MNLDLHGRRALVTGSTAGIGLATARLFAEEGAIVVVNGRTESRVHAAIAAICGQACLLWRNPRPPGGQEVPNCVPVVHDDDAICAAGLDGRP